MSPTSNSEENRRGFPFAEIDIDESDPRFALEKMKPGEPDTVKLYAKHLYAWQQMSRYWQERLDTAKRCMNYARRDIFTKGQRSKYLNVQNKWPIEPQCMRPVLDALADQVNDAAPGINITMEDDNPPENVAPADVVQLVLRWLYNKHKLDQKSKRAMRNGLYCSYPQWLFFDRIESAGGLQVSLDVTLLPWAQVLCTQHFQEFDGADIEHLSVTVRRTKAQLESRYPDRTDAYNDHVAMLREDPGFMMEALHMDNADFTSENRMNFVYDMVKDSAISDSNGLYTVVYDFFAVKRRKRVWINEEKEDVVELPADWSQIRKDQWLNDNPGYDIGYTDTIPSLWVTTWGANGFIWDNAPHWFQETQFDHPDRCVLPAIPYIPDMIDNMPVGKGEDMLPLVLLKAVCKTEGLSEVRKGTGTIITYEEGAVKQPGRLRHELTKEQSVVVIKKNHDARTAVKIDHRKPNDTFLKFDDRLSGELEETHRINPAIQGEHAPRQSLVAKEREISQGLKPQSPYVWSYQNFRIATSQLLCYMFPYVLTEQMLITIEDEFGVNKQEAEVNIRTFDQEGYGKVIANDLTSAKYRIVPTIGDDSATTKEQQLVRFSQLLEALGNTLFQMNPAFLGNLFSSFPNRYARECGKYLLEHAEQTMQIEREAVQADAAIEQKKLTDKKEIETLKVLLPRLMMKTDAGDIQEAPMGFQVFAQYVQALQNQATAMTQAQTAAPVAALQQ